MSLDAPLLGKPASGPDAPPWRLARFLRATVCKLFLALYRTRFLGVEHLPSDGGYVIAGNHLSYLDPMLLWCGTPRPTHFLARDNLFEAPIVGWALPRLWGIPISRASADREAITRATNLLKAGEVIGIFPEGTRQDPNRPAGEPAEAHAGVAFIALRAGAPVVPVGITGTDRALPKGARLPRFPKVTFRFGEPVIPEEFADLGRKERLEAMTAEIMRRIAALRAEVMEE
jgi:1-acyl-sn-glycerol-3-phosphate acyltransferase